MNTNDSVLVWDILVRIFHWSLVGSFAVAYITAEQEGVWHIYAGYTVLGLITFRLVWGFIGTPYARFRQFLYAPKTLVEYLRSLREPQPKHYLGHNPAGGWMIIALLLCLFVISFSGLKLYAIEEGKGPLAGNPSMPIITAAQADDDEYDDDDEKHDDEKHAQEEFWEDIHEFVSHFTLFLIFLHITGVVVASRLHGENLVKAMITGKKSAAPSNPHS